MENVSANNKRIAKNTIYLYLRQILVMVVSLYTSRVVLATLGEVDYGIYNVVGGIVTLFTFLNFAMGCATSRFITFELGKKDYQKLNTVFSFSVVIHILIAIIILILGETIGLWFFNTHMNIPSERMYAAGWVYQFSIFACMVNIMCVPYNALITSHEKMNIYAIFSIIETVLKLAIVWILIFYGHDKLILYAIMIFSVSLLMRILNQIYTIRTFRYVKFIRAKDFTTLKEMLNYAGWSLVGSLATILFDQGVNVLLNIFFGPAVNAARGVSMQIKNAVVSLSNNFQQAINPQINKSYASGELNYMHTLLFASSKYTYFVMFLMVFPISLLIKQILSIWLVDVPAHTANFTILILITCILQAIGQPISNAAGANGHIRNFQLIVGGINLSLLPAAWLLLSVYPVPEVVFGIHILVNVIAQIARLIIVRPMISLSLKEYFQKVVQPCGLVTIASLPIPIFLKYQLNENILASLIIIVVCISTTMLTIYYIGMRSNERSIIREKIRTMSCKILNK